MQEKERGLVALISAYLDGTPGTCLLWVDYQEEDACQPHSVSTVAEAMEFVERDFVASANDGYEECMLTEEYFVVKNGVVEKAVKFKMLSVDGSPLSLVMVVTDANGTSCEHTIESIQKRAA